MYLFDSQTFKQIWSLSQGLDNKLSLWIEYFSVIWTDLTEKKNVLNSMGFIFKNVLKHF